MKTMTIVIMGLWLVSLLACKKDEDISPCLQLEGTWQCESWKEDDEEFFGDNIFIISAELTFKSLVDGKGDYDWNITYLIGGTEMIIGAYEPNEACEEVIITPKAGVATTYDFEISGDQLILSGLINNVMIELRFQKTN